MGAVEEGGMPDIHTHIFRVELRPEIYRDIEIASGMPLDFLAAAIVEAFGFDLDHPFGFYSKFTGNVFAAKPRYELLDDVERDPDALSVEEVTVAEAFRRLKKALLFVFDYGDNWRFRVTFTGRGRMTQSRPYSRVLDTVGEAPAQYPIVNTADE
jgi:Plasmid pRiA4b ORF-3-like protein